MKKYLLVAPVFYLGVENYMYGGVVVSSCRLLLVGSGPGGQWAGIHQEA